LTYSSIIMHTQDERVVSLGVEATSDTGKQGRETKVNKLDLNKTGNSLNSSKSIVLDQSESDKVIKGNMAHKYYQLYDVCLFFICLNPIHYQMIHYTLF
jgi:hypothetical protein